MRKSLQELQVKGEQIFRKILPVLRRKYKPTQYVSIDPETGKYYLGDDLLQAAAKAKKEHPKGFFFFAQVGEKGEKIV